MISDVSYLPQLANRLLELGCACLADTPNGRPGDCGLYWTQPPADCCDAFSVWLGRMYVAKQFPIEWTGPAKCSDLTTVAPFGLTLYRNCWPVVEPDPFKPFPPGEATTTAAADLMMDAVKLYCCVMGDLTAGLDSTVLDGELLNVSIGGLEPARPLGGCAGYTFTVRIGLDVPCCL